MIALYERSAEMNPFSSKFDAWQVGKCQLTEEEKLGYELFKEKGQHDKERLLHYRRSSRVNLYELDGVVDYF